MDKRTALYVHHEQLGAKFVPFAGWSMPVQYSGTLAEHAAVRERAGLFDVSHMGLFCVEGPDASALLQYLTPNDLARIGDGQAQYSMFLNDTGGVVDDIIIYRERADRFLIVVNAGNLEKDWHWIMAHQRGDVRVTDLSKDTALIALQGPKAQAMLQPLVAGDLATLKRFGFRHDTIAGVPVTVARTGYTGSPGFEMFVPSASAGVAWKALLDAGTSHGILPCGLGARDTLRLEMAYPLHGHEISEKISPLEARLDWVLKLDKPEFIGRDALRTQRDKGLARVLVGLRMTDSGIPRDGYSVVHAHKPVGYVTSGTMSPSLKVGIGLALVPPALSTPGTMLAVDIRGRERAAEVVATPFFKPAQ